MKVLMINGSPHTQGCTRTALAEVAKSLGKEGIETEVLNIGTKTVRGCVACGKCAELKRCVYEDDPVNEIIEKAKTADAFVFGSPVYYSSASGQITSLMDRLFRAGGTHFKHKPAAAVVSCRRGGATAALDQLNKYFLISSMLVVGSQYWNMVHGNKPEEVLRDLEGTQTMRTLGLNMAWVLKSLEAGRKAGIEKPLLEAQIKTNFIQ